MTKAKKPVDKMTKAELLRELKKAHKRIEKLERSKPTTDAEWDMLNKAPAPQPANGWVPPWQKALTNSFEGTK